MSFLPFYAPSQAPPKVIIAGGGYAGMAALISFYRYCPSADVTLIDPREDHFKITHLHELFRRSPANLRVPFAALEDRFGFRHVCGDLKFTEKTLNEWQRNRALSVNDEMMPFDYLLLATGASATKVEESEGLFDLEDLCREQAPEIIRRLTELDENLPISLVGAGATGVQFFFEIAQWLKTRGKANPLRVIDAGDRVLQQFTPELGRYVSSRMVELGIDFLPRTLFLGLDGADIRIEDKDTGEETKLSSGVTFCFVGKRSSLSLDTNFFGQVTTGRGTLSHIFAAGDCSRYRSLGSNAMTAQSAVRKGKLCARNILRHSGKLKVLEPYLHRDLGYVISLGPQDAIGWIGLQSNVVGGPPAVVVKELVEAQHELLLAGIDTYLI
jgi:NADH dehydrogenase